MKDESEKSGLPQCVRDYIELVVKKMGYRRKVRAEVRQELIDHFEDALHGVTNEQERVEKAMTLIREFGDPKTLATLIRQGKKRCRPVWLKALIRCVQAAVIAILIFVVYVGFLLTGRPYISTDYIAELNKLVRPTADERMNAQPYYDQAAAMLKPEPNDLLQPWNKALTAEGAAAAKQWVSEGAAAVELIRKGNERPYAWVTYSSADGTMLGVLLPNLHNQKRLVYFMGWTAWLKAQNGRFDEAFDDVIQCYLLGQHSESKSVLIEQLVAVSMESYSVSFARHIIAMPNVTAESLARFQARYQDVMAKSDFVMHYEGESMFIKDTIQRTHTKSGRVAPLAMGRFLHLSGGLDREISVYDTVGAAAAGIYMALRQQGDRDAMLQNVNDFYDKTQQIAAMTPYQARTVKPSFDEVLRKYQDMNVLLQFLLPAIQKTIEVSWRTNADCHALVAQIALERYKKQKGAYPESLEELQKAGYLKELPMDPWSDGPLIYRRTEDGYTLYSVGTNFIDDGGESINKDGKAVQAPNVNALDIVFWPQSR